jgi:hypothetical protein
MDSSTLRLLYFKVKTKHYPLDRLSDSRDILEMRKDSVPVGNRTRFLGSLVSAPYSKKAEPSIL